MGGNLKPKSVLSEYEKKLPRTPQGSSDDEKPTWSFQIIDIGGPWCFTKMSMDDFNAILDRIKKFESMKWSEIKGKRNHSIDLSSLSPEAQKRLEEINQDDTESIFSFTVDGERRFHGIRLGPVCRLLWWDPEHEVCPSQLKHT
jgi:hypothetical protein